MGSDRYQCAIDRLLSFSKLPEYRRRFRFRKYRIVFAFDEKNVKAKVVEPFADRFRRFHPYHIWTAAGLQRIHITWWPKKKAAIVSAINKGLCSEKTKKASCLYRGTNG